MVECSTAMLDFLIGSAVIMIYEILPAMVEFCNNVRPFSARCLLASATALTADDTRQMFSRKQSSIATFLYHLYLALIEDSCLVTWLSIELLQGLGLLWTSVG